MNESGQMPPRGDGMGPDRGQARYRLLSRIAVGGMAEIFLATLQGEAGFEREVIIKKILPGYADELEFAKRLVDEGLLAGKLHHSNIVQVLDLGRLGPDYFIAMEYVDGPDLRDVLARAVAKGFLLPVPIAVHILREVARALAYAHDKKDEGGKSLNIIHRDISPANVLISWEGAVKLGDFGIAKASQRLVHTLTGVLQGKFPYMSPEQAGGGECDQRSDVFSFGATAYELLTLVRPFQAESDLKTLERVKCAQHPPLLKHRDNLPSELVEVVHTCLARDRDQRFANGAQLERALATLMQKCGWVVTEGDVADMLAALYGDDRVSRLAEARSSPEPLAVVTASPLDGRVLVPDAPRHKSSVNVTAQESPRTRSVVAPTWKLRAQRQRRTWVLWTALMVVLALALAADFRFFHVFLGRSEPEPVPPVLPEPAAVEPAPPGRREAAAESVAPVPAPLPKCTPASPEEQKQVLPGSAALPKCAPVPAQPALPVKAAEAAGEAKGGAGQAGTGTGTGEKDVQDAAPGADEEQATSTKLSVLPPDAVIFVDGRHLGTQPQYVEVAPHRTRKVRIEAEGFAAVEFELSHPGPDKLARKLEKLATGKLWFRYVPASARVFVDGKQVEGKNGLNIVEMELPVGEHHILVSDGARERSETAFIEQGKIWKRTIEIAP